MTPSALLNRIALMHRTHGVGPTFTTCGECSACVNYPRRHAGRGSVVRYVCLRARTRTASHGEILRAEWRKYWDACRLFTANET